MKTTYFYLIIFLISVHNSYSQTEVSQADLKETIGWINKKFFDNSYHRIYFIQNVEFIAGEPILNVVMTRGVCTSEKEICKIPIKKIRPIRFVKNLTDDYYFLEFETKNGEEFVWFQSEDKSCGQIGTNMDFWLNSTIENDDLINRITLAFNHLMMLYGNDGKEKF